MSVTVSNLENELGSHYIIDPIRCSVILSSVVPQSNNENIYFLI